MGAPFIVTGSNAAALFTLKVYRGESMVLLAMNWKAAKPPEDFVGFAIQYKEPPPHDDRFYSLNNRLAFSAAGGKVNPTTLSTMLSPIQKFRWVHFPRNAELPGSFIYRVSPVFMDAHDVLSYGAAQEVAIELRRETYPGLVNVAFTRGFVSSQAFVDRYGAKAIPQLLPKKSADGLTFKPTFKTPKDSQAALGWMGFEAREAMLAVLDQAIADTSAARVGGDRRVETAGQIGRRRKRDPPAHEEAAAQQDHRRRRTRHAARGLRIDELQLARVVRAEQQRDGPEGRGPSRGVQERVR